MIGMDTWEDITRLVVLGETFEGSGLPQDSEHREAWEAVQADVAAMLAEGLMIEIPFDD